MFAGIIVASVGMFSYANGRAALRESAAVNVASIALEKEAALEIWREERLENVTAIANLPSMIENTRALVAPVPDPSVYQVAHDNLVQDLQSIGAQHFLDMLVIEPKLGMVIASTDRGEQGKFIENRPYFLNGKKGPHVQNPYYSFQLQGVAMTFSAPILSRSGTLLGVLAGRGDLTEINDIVTRSSGMYQSEDVFIVDNANLFLTQPRFISDSAVLQRGIRTEVVNRCLSHSSGSLSSTDYRGVATLAAYRWLSESQLCLVVKVDQAEAFAPVNAFRNKMAILGGLVLAAAALLGLVLATSINRPLLAMQKGVQGYRSGELDVRLSETSRDELGDLAHAFNEMAIERGRVEEDLRIHRDNLEEQVAERTQELSNANTRLEVEIIERRAAAAELRILAANLERSNRELEQFASVASHDLQEPLRKVRAFGERLNAEFSQALTDRGQDYLNRMLNASERMQTLINDLLTLSLVTTKGDIFVPVDLAAVVGGVLDDLEPTIEEVSGRIELNDLPIIDGDPTQMRQLIQNLVSNSLKFRKAEGEPIIKIRGQLLDGPSINGDRDSSRETLLQLTVEDNGIGFDEKHLDRIFNVFQRLHGRGQYPGTGIGLAVCRKIVERHSGTITATSKPRQGATFIVTLPVKQLEGVREEWTETVGLLRS